MSSNHHGFFSGVQLAVLSGVVAPKDRKKFHGRFFSPLQVELWTPTYNDRLWAHLVGDKFPRHIPSPGLRTLAEWDESNAMRCEKKGNICYIVLCFRKKIGREGFFCFFSGGDGRATNFFWIFGVYSSLCFLATGNFVVFFGVCV